MRQLVLVKPVLAAVAALSTASCAGEDAPQAPLASPAPSSVASSGSASVAPASPSPLASPSAPAVPQPTFSILYEAGKVSGDTGRLRVKVGQKVTIRVTSDVADEVHLHGYDVSVDVAAGGSAVVAFTAKIPGVFALELEKLGKELAKVQVQ
jgi:hypothetical protein